MTVLCRWNSWSAFSLQCKNISTVSPQLSPAWCLLWSLASVSQSQSDLIYGSGRICPCLGLPMDWCMSKLAVIKSMALFVEHPSSPFSEWDCSPVWHIQYLSGEVTKGYNLPAVECDSGTGCVRNTCEEPHSRLAGVSERWWDVSVDQREHQDPCQDWRERQGEKAWVTSAKWTLLLNVSSVGEMLQKRILKCEFVLDLL